MQEWQCPKEVCAWQNAVGAGRVVCWYVNSNRVSVSLDQQISDLIDG